MGYEVRKVKPDWEHPKDNQSRFQPKLDQTYPEAVQEFIEALSDWVVVHPDGYDDEDYTFSQVLYSVPDPKFYMPVWTKEEKTAYQVYENITEGTPVSPVYQTAFEAFEWLVANLPISKENAQRMVDSAE